MLRPAISLAPLRTELLQPSLPAPDRSKGRSVITTGTFVSFLTGLSPAALSALWAAHQTKPCARRASSEFRVPHSKLSEKCETKPMWESENRRQFESKAFNC